MYASMLIFSSELARKMAREGAIMSNKKLIYFIGLLSGLLLLVTSEGRGQPKQERKGPIITQAFAVDKGYYGSIWRIYIEAKDPGGEMLRIAATVDQVGLGYYPPDWVYLKPKYSKYLKGYLQWNTFSSRAGSIKEGTQITLKVTVIDRAGNESNEAVFPFTFQSGVSRLPVLPAPFDQGDNPRLGYLSIDLFDLDETTNAP
jgi:hypothetical protein